MPDPAQMQSVEVGQRWRISGFILSILYMDDEITIAAWGDGPVRPEYRTPVLIAQLREHGRLLEAFDA